MTCLKEMSLKIGMEKSAIRGGGHSGLKSHNMASPHKLAHCEGGRVRRLMANVMKSYHFIFRDIALFPAPPSFDYLIYPLQFLAPPLCSEMAIRMCEATMNQRFSCQSHI